MTEDRGTPPRGGAAVFVNWVDRDTGDWEAVWQHGSIHDSVRGAHAEVLAWAWAQPAEHYWVFNGTEFVPLTDDD